MEFPQYRKYKNIETYFKIISEKEFEELLVIGKRYQIHSVIANQYPEMLRIQDMLNNENEAWELLTKEQFLKKERFILSSYKEMKR